MKDLIRRIEARFWPSALDKKSLHRRARHTLRRLLKLEIDEAGILCPRCKNEKPEIEFNKDPTRAGWCNDCHHDWIEEQYI